MKTQLAVSRYYVMSSLSLDDDVHRWHVDTNEGNNWRRVSQVPMTHEDAVALCERLNREAEKPA